MRSESQREKLEKFVGNGFVLKVGIASSVQSEE
jgi:hypothetical protein